MTQSLLLRREPFGGILVQQYGDNVMFLNHTGFEIARCIAKGFEDSKILKYIISLFAVADIDVVNSDIQRVQKIISDADNWSKDNYYPGIPQNTDEVSAIPTLSAPLDLHWEVTSRCNLYCRHCYNRSSLAAACEPSQDQIRSVINEFGSIKMRNIAISGGEPLMRKDIKTIIELVRPLASIITLCTNGTLIDDENSSWFPGLIDGVNLSLDAGNKQEYERFRGKKGSFDRCIQCLRLLVKREIPVAIQTTISRFNIDQLDDLAKLIIKEGATSWIVRLPIASGRAVENEDDFLSHEEILQKEHILNEVREQYESELAPLKIGLNFAWSYREPYVRTQRKDEFVSCAAATVLAALLADGRMAPCALFADTDFKSDVVWNDGFLNQWKNAKCLKDMRSIRLSRIPQCFHCADYGKICSTGCRAKSYLNGDLYTDSDCEYQSQDFSHKNQLF